VPLPAATRPASESGRLPPPTLDPPNAMGLTAAGNRRYLTIQLGQRKAAV
jgi:hypothetical protein